LVRASNGSILGTFPVGNDPVGIAVGGGFIWISGRTAEVVEAFSARNGASRRTITVGEQPIGVLFDGTNVWVANQLSNTVNKISLTGQ